MDFDKGKFDYYVPETNGSGEEKYRSILRNLRRWDAAPDVTAFVFRVYLRPQIPLHFFKLDGQHKVVKVDEERKPRNPTYRFVGRRRSAGQWVLMKVIDQYAREMGYTTARDPNKDELRAQKLRLLKEFRRRLDDSDTIDELQGRMQQFFEDNPGLEIYQEDYGGDITRYYCLKRLEQLPGVGETTAKTLYRHDFQTLAVIQDYDEDDLKDIPGIGDVTAGEILDYINSLEDDYIGID